MGFKTFDLDNPDQAKQYKKEKNHKSFIKENPNVNTTPSYETEEEPDTSSDEIGTNLLAKVVKVDQLRVRKYPEGEVLRLINKDDEVRIISDFDDIWYKIELPDGCRGYVMKEFLLTYLDDHNLDDKSRRCKCHV
jgi:hypothetical protein